MNFLISLKRRLRSGLGGVTLLAAALGYQTAATAATPEATKSKPSAAVSGDLAICTAWDEGDINALIAGFNKVYPNVKVTEVRSEGGRGALLERMLTEIDSGKAMADVYSTASRT
jgi:iron(III) transport system substrate-binding protein